MAIILGRAKLQSFPCDRWEVGWSEIAEGTSRYTYWTLHSGTEYPEFKIFKFSDVIQSDELDLV